MRNDFFIEMLLEIMILMSSRSAVQDFSFQNWNSKLIVKMQK